MKTKKTNRKELLKLRTLKSRIEQLPEGDADVMALQTSIQLAYEVAREMTVHSQNPYDYYTNFLLNQIKHSACAIRTYRQAAPRQQVLAFQRYQRYVLADLTSFVRYGVLD